MRLRPIPILFAFLGLFALVPRAGAELKVPRVSPSANVTQTLGLTDLTVVYCRPGVKDRVIWGDLVPYDKPWRTGANEATRFTTTDSIRFGGKALAPGTYALFTIPGRDQWTVVINAEKDLWGAFEYKPERDVLRVNVKPSAAEPQEWMEFSFEELTPASVNLVLRWEKLRVAVPIEVDVHREVLANARAAILGLKNDAWRVPYQASNYCLTNDISLEDGQRWIDQSLGIEQNFYNLSLEARWQMKAGRKDAAIQTARKALEIAEASVEKPETGPTEKLLGEWTAKK